MYCANENQLNERYAHLQAVPNAIRYKQFLSYVTGLWHTRREWATSYRALLPTRGTDTTNYVEALFRVLKDNILDRVKAFNITQLTDFILTRYETYLEQRLLDFAHGRIKSYLLRRFTLQESNINLDSIQVATHGMYMVPSETTENVCYMVDLKDGFCTCTAGVSGKLCKHISAVLKLLNIHTAHYAFDENSVLKEIVYEVATGKRGICGWVKPLSFNPTAVINHNPTLDVGEGSGEVAHEHETSNTDKSTNQNFNGHSISADDSSTSKLHDTSNVVEQFDMLFERIKTGYVENQEVFLPAMQKMVKNANKYLKTETGLVSAMYTFGRNTGEPRKPLSVLQTKRSGCKIHVQPTSIGRRKVTLGGKQRQQGGRPPGLVKRSKEHNYSVFGELPCKKKKASHSITECVFNNVSLGRNRHSK